MKTKAYFISLMALGILIAFSIKGVKNHRYLLSVHGANTQSIQKLSNISWWGTFQDSLKVKKKEHKITFRDSSLGNMNVVLTGPGNWNSFQVTTKTRRSTLSQLLKVPAGWFIPYVEKPRTPSFFLWNQKNSQLIFIIASRSSGVYGVRSPIAYQIRHGKWTLVNTQPGMTEFTNRGSFLVRSNRLYVWDYVAAENKSHYSTQKYWLKVFKVQNGHFIFVKKLITKRSYNDPYVDFDSSDQNPPEVPYNNDPLTEFGLKWGVFGESLKKMQVF